MSQLEPERSSTFHFSSEELIRSCPLPKSLYSHKSRTYKTLTIEASKIEPLSSFLKHNKHLEYSYMERLIEMIGRQLYHLEVEQNKGISIFHLDDITVFHSNDAVYFSITNEEHIHDIDDENHMELTIPSSSSSSSDTRHPRHTSKNIAFYSPEYKEFMSKKSLPYAIHFKSSYYSFGLLCLYCYVTRDISQITAATATATATHDSHFESIVAPIIHTKIYWFLKHVLRKIPTERRYICV